MTLDQLRYFQAVCRYAGVSRAAAALNISQPSVSNAIKSLEREFGVELFTRERKRLRLTKEGILMSELADKLLVQSDEMVRIMTEVGKKDKVLRLGVPPMIGSVILPVLYNKFFAEYPNIRIHITEDGSSALRQLLEEDQLDMAFLPHTQPFESDLCAEPVTVLQNMCCVSKAHPLAAEKTICFEQLVNEPLILFKNSFFQTERILQAFSNLSCTPNIVLDTTQLSTIQNMIKNNSAVGFLFEPLLSATPDILGIALDPPMTTQVSLVWRNSKNLSADMRNLVRFMNSIQGAIWSGI